MLTITPWRLSVHTEVIWWSQTYDISHLDIVRCSVTWNLILAPTHFFAWPMVDFDQEKHKTTFVLGCLGIVLFFSHLCRVEDLIGVYVLYAYIARQIWLQWEQYKKKFWSLTFWWTCLHTSYKTRFPMTSDTSSLHLRGLRCQLVLKWRVFLLKN